MDEVSGAQIAQERALFSLLAVFAGIAMMLACVGTYGMMAYSVSARSRDVGPVTFLLVVLVFVVVVMIAVAVPALRAGRLHPARVLRQ